MPNFACNESQLPSIGEAADQEHKLRCKIEWALAAGKRKRARYFTGLYLKSGSAKLVATIEANKKLKPHRKEKSELVPGISGRSSTPVRMSLNSQERKFATLMAVAIQIRAKTES